MEGLAFPLCLLRCLVSAGHAGTAPQRSLSHGLLEGVVSVLLHKHVRDRGLGKGLNMGLAAQELQEQQQQQQLVMPGSPPPNQA